MSAMAMPEPPEAGPDSPAGAVPAEPAPVSPVASSAPEEAPVLSIADGVERSLDPRSIRLDRIVGWISTAAISSGLFVGLLIALVAVPLAWIKVLVAVFWAAVTAFLAWSAHFWPPLEYRYASYKVDAQGIEIRRGVVWRVVINVPRSRVQHTDVSQGPLERSHGLGTLVIYTAGTDHARVDLQGLDHATALRIRDHLLPRESDDAV